MKRPLIFLFGLVILIGSLLACGEANNTGTAANNSGSTTTTAQSTTAPQQQHFKVKQTVKVGDTWQVTINSATKSNGSEFIKPKSGNVYLIIDTSMKNISSQEQNASSLIQWKLQDDTGQAYTIALNPNNTAAPDGKVASSAPLRGALTYEVPSSMHKYTLAFQSDIVSGGQTIWDLSI